MQGGRKDSNGKKKIKAIAEMSEPDSESLFYSESLEQSIIGDNALMILTFLMKMFSIKTQEKLALVG